MFWKKTNSKNHNPDFLHDDESMPEGAHEDRARRSKINLIVPFMKSEHEPSAEGGSRSKKLRILFSYQQPSHISAMQQRASPASGLNEKNKKPEGILKRAGDLLLKFFHGKSAPAKLKVPHKVIVKKGVEAEKKSASQKEKKQHAEQAPIDWKHLTFQQIIQQIALRIKPLHKSSNRKRLELNLITVEFIDPSQVMRQAVKLGLLAFCAVMAVLISWLVLQGTEEKTDQNIQKMKEHIAFLKRETQDLRKKQKENQIIADRVLAVSALLKNHIYYTKFFQALEDLTRFDVSYEPIAIGLKTKYDLSVQTVSVGSLLNQLQAFRHAKNVVTDVSMNSYMVEIQKDENGENLGSSFGKERSVVSSLFHIEFDPRIYFKN